MSDDVYSRVDYRRMIAWPARIRRESAFLLGTLEQAPERSVLDLGCGTGEHSRFLAAAGYRVLGVDRSESMLEKAGDSPLPEGLQFVLSDLVEVAGVSEARFGAAISLGNTLPHLTGPEQFKCFLSGLHLRLLPGALFISQVLNYERIFSQQIRYLPLDFRDDAGSEIVFLRLMELREDGTVLFCPSSLRFDLSSEEPLSVLRSKAVELMGWRRDQLVRMLESCGFVLEAVHGDMESGLYQPDKSSDLVTVARRS